MAPCAVEGDEGGGAEVVQEVGVEARAAPPVAVGPVGEALAGGQVAGRRGEEQEAARDDDADAAVERAASGAGRRREGITFVRKMETHQ